MSLIDEALKRAQEAHGKESEAARQRPWTPAPLPDRGRSNRRRFLKGAALAALSIVLGISTLLLWRRSAETKPASEAGERMARPTAVPPTPIPLEEVVVPPPPRGVASSPQPTPVRERPASPSASAPPPASASAAPPGLAAPPAAAPTPARAPSDRPGALVSGRTYTGPVVLPSGARLELEGIVYSETNATAVINGRILGEGAGIEGFTVDHIEENRVTLSGNGVTIHLAVR